MAQGRKPVPKIGSMIARTARLGTVRSVLAKLMRTRAVFGRRLSATPRGSAIAVPTMSAVALSQRCVVSAALKTFGLLRI